MMGFTLRLSELLPSGGSCERQTGSHVFTAVVCCIDDVDCQQFIGCYGESIFYFENFFINIKIVANYSFVVSLQYSLRA